MSKLTSAPWFVDFNAHKSHGHCRVMGEMCTPVATVFNTVDAKLIAASPDLLEVLELVMADVNSYESRTGNKVQHWADKAREVIAKAKGEV